MVRAWKVISTAFIGALAGTSLAVGIDLGSWPIAILLAVAFWPSTVMVVYYSIKQGELPVIVGGPSFLLAGRQHLTPTELQKRNAPYS